MGVGRDYVCHLVAGRKLYSPLMRRLARKIKVPEPALREYLADHSAERHSPHAA
jgi:hypothetical protein